MRAYVKKRPHEAAGKEYLAKSRPEKARVGRNIKEGEGASARIGNAVPHGKNSERRKARQGEIQQQQKREEKEYLTDVQGDRGISKRKREQGARFD